MRSKACAVTSFLTLALLVACSPPSPPSGELNLPEGNAERGQEVFVELGCVACHNVRDVELPSSSTDGPVKVMLGSRTSIRSYGDLVTSIVNPSHRLSPRYLEEDISSDGESLMVVFNDIMTVTQLTDLVAFLQPRYENVSRPRYRYRTYDYGSSSDDADSDSVD